MKNVYVFGKDKHFRGQTLDFVKNFYNIDETWEEIETPDGHQIKDKKNNLEYKGEPCVEITNEYCYKKDYGTLSEITRIDELITYNELGQSVRIEHKVYSYDEYDDNPDKPDDKKEILSSEDALEKIKKDI